MLITFIFPSKFPFAVKETNFDVSIQAESDITAYTYERTLIMEQRTEMLKNMRLGKVVQPQTIVDKSHEAAQDVKDVKGWS